MPVNASCGKGMGLTPPSADRPAAGMGQILAHHNRAMLEEAADAREAEQKRETDDELRASLWLGSRVPDLHGEKALLFAPLHDGTGWGMEREKLCTRVVSGRGLLGGLYGDRGTGKTQMVVDAIQVACKRMIRCRYAVSMDFFGEIRSTFGRRGRTEQDVIDEWSGYPVLVIDEFGVRGETDWEDKQLANLFDKRYGAQRITIVISNFNEESFKNSLGPSAVSRMEETGELIHCDWPSFRKGGKDAV